MKSEVATSFSSSLLLLLFLLFLSGPSPASSASPKLIFDIHGHPVLTGSKYYLVHLIRGAGSGGPTMAPPRNGTCPLDVVRDRPLFDGVTVTLTLADGGADKGTTFHSGTPLHIEFTGPKAERINTCHSSMAWSVGNSDVETGLRTITTGSPVRFTVVESSVPHTTNTYVLVYCGASICVNGVCTRDNACRAVGESERRLYAGGSTFVFYFRKA